MKIIFKITLQFIHEYVYFLFILIIFIIFLYLYNKVMSIQLYIPYIFIQIQKYFPSLKHKLIIL